MENTHKNIVILYMHGFYDKGTSCSSETDSNEC